MENEREKKRATAAENKMVNSYRRHQMEAATVRQQQEGLAIKLYEERMIKDKKEFQEYAQQTIAKKAASGCLTFPLEHVVRAGCHGSRVPIYEAKMCRETRSTRNWTI